MREISDLSADRTIWLYWDAGLPDAPELVKICAESWVKRNTSWRVIHLDNSNLGRYVNMDDVRAATPRLTVQAFSDLLRARLLKLYGGVWADATTYCNRPLDEWLPEHAYDGTFLFKSHEKELIASWFIYSRRNSYLISRLCHEAETYLVDNRNFRPFMDVRFFWRFWLGVERYGGRLNYFLWRHPLYKKVFGYSPYFWFFFLFGYLFVLDERIRAIYDGIATIMLDGSYDLFLARVVKAGEPIPEAITKRFFEEVIPVYKLNYRYSGWERVIELLRAKL
jgi:hypothetical protein